MKISQAIKTLTEIQTKYGDISITGGCMLDDQPLTSITVTDVNGMEVWPTDPNNLGDDWEMDEVFLE